MNDNIFQSVRVTHFFPKGRPLGSASTQESTKYRLISDQAKKERRRKQKQRQRDAKDEIRGMLSDLRRDAYEIRMRAQNLFTIPGETSVEGSVIAEIADRIANNLEGPFEDQLDIALP